MSTILAQRSAEFPVQSFAAPSVEVFASASTRSATVSSATPSREWSPREVAQSIAHEINQPLAAILLQAGAARRWIERAEPDIARALEALDHIASSGRRMDEIVCGLQGLVERQAVNAEAVRVDSVLRQSLALLECPLQHHAIETRIMLDLDACEVHANRVQLQQVVVNLLSNAIEALATLTDRPRILCLSSRRLGLTLVEVTVSDNGPGVPPENRAHIFGARFSTKQQGSGLGLSISAAIAEAHGGHIDHQPGLPHGAMFRLVLPVGPVC